MELNRIQENLVGDIKAVQASEPMPALSVIKRSTTRRVRFVDQLSNGRPTARSKESCKNNYTRSVFDTQ